MGLILGLVFVYFVVVGVFCCWFCFVLCLVLLGWLRLVLGFVLWVFSFCFHLVWVFLVFLGFVEEKSPTSLCSPTSITPSALLANSDFVGRVIFKEVQAGQSQDTSPALPGVATKPAQHINKRSKERPDTGKRPQTSRRQEWEAHGEPNSLTSI